MISSIDFIVILVSFIVTWGFAKHFYFNKEK
jgi:hypothetical protein